MRPHFPFWVNAVDALHPEDATGLHLKDIFDCNPSDPSERWSQVLLSNYMIDLPWLLEAAPGITYATDRVLVLSGETGTATHVRGGGTARPQWTSTSPLLLNINPFVAAARARGLNMQTFAVVEPPLPFSFGTHHTKMALCVNARGMRVVVCTANFICADWTAKSQGIYVQDFPRRVPGKSTVEAGDSERGRDFAKHLHHYLSGCGLFSDRVAPDAPAHPLGPFGEASMLDAFDFSSAAIWLISSIPGRKSGANVGLSGMGRLARVLTMLPPPASIDSGKEEESSVVLSWQYSSQGSLTDPFLTALQQCMSVSCQRHTDLQVIYPTEEEVRQSLEGWRGGLSLPVRTTNCHPFINERLHRWGHRLPDGSPVKVRGCDRQQWALPHMKSYAAVSGDRRCIHWFLLTSANLSQAAWGSVRKPPKHADPALTRRLPESLFIRSYELGVLYDVASATFISGRSFSVTRTALPPPISEVHESEERLRGVQMGFASNEEPKIFLPYDVLHPQPYASTCQLRSGVSEGISSQDIPWVVDAPHRGVDSLGDVLDTSIEKVPSFYGLQSWTAPLRELHLPRGSHKRPREYIVIDDE